MIFSVRDFLTNHAAIKRVVATVKSLRSAQIGSPRRRKLSFTCVHDLSGVARTSAGTKSVRLLPNRLRACNNTRDGRLAAATLENHFTEKLRIVLNVGVYDAARR